LLQIPEMIAGLASDRVQDQASQIQILIAKLPPNSVKFEHRQVAD
jgi:hypothetical protein